MNESLRATGSASALLSVMWWYAGALPTAPLSAQDRVVVQPLATAAGKLGISGNIEELTGQKLVIREGNGRELRILTPDQYRLVEIETRQSPEYEAGLERFRAGDDVAASAHFEKALVAENRRWVRREILAWLVRCAVRQRDWAKAGSRFLHIVESDPSTPHFRLIPLRWTPDDAVSQPLRQLAVKWLADTGETSRLLGASYLLDDEHRATDALSALQVLTRSTDARIQVLATCQLWRSELLKQEPSGLQVQGWQHRVASMPTELRSGPSYLLGRAHAARHAYELAAVAYLWPSLVDADRPDLAARGLLEAAHSLRHVGQTASAVQLLEELRTRFPTDPATNEATSLFRELQLP